MVTLTEAVHLEGISAQWSRTHRPVQEIQETQVQSLGLEDLLEEVAMATASSILAWRSPWSEEPGGLQSIRSQRVTHD